MRFISRIKNLVFLEFSKTLLYFAGSIIQALLALVSSPIYSKHLTGEDFGVLGYFDSLRSVLTPVFILSLSSVYLMKYFRQDEEDNKKLLYNLTVHLFIINLFTSLVSFALIYFYFLYADVKIPLSPYIWYIVVGLTLDNLKNMVLINYRIRKKAMNFFLFSVANTVLNFSIGIYLVKWQNMGLNGRMLAPILSSLLLIPICLYVLKGYSKPSFDSHKFLESLKISFPLVLAAYAYVPILSFDFFYLERLNNLSELGLYSIALTMAGYVQLFFVALSLTFEPDIFKAVATNEYRKLLKIGLAIFLPYMIFLAAYVLLSPYIIDFLTSGRYVAAGKYLLPAVIHVFLIGVFAYLDKIFVALSKTKLNLLFNIVGGLSSILFIFLFANWYGFFGAIYGKIGAISLMITVAIVVLRKVLRETNVSAQE